jgi:WD40 repeat protein
LYLAKPEEEREHFSKLMTLQGHEDWVKSIAFTTFKDPLKEYLIMASAAQDRYIRLWTIEETTEKKESSGLCAWNLNELERELK